MTPPLAARLLLAERYAELGLNKAATCVLQRARVECPDASAETLVALVKVLAASGDGRAARDAAAELAALEPGPASRVMLGEAQLAAGERDAARFAFAAALDKLASSDPLVVRALLGRAAVAISEDDHSGAGAAAMTAIDGLLSAARAGHDLASSIPQMERAIAIAISAGRADDLSLVFSELPATTFPIPFPTPFLEALTLSALGSPDPEIAEKLEAACEINPKFLPARLRLIELRLRRRHRDGVAREKVVAELESLANELDSGVLNSSPALAAAAWLSLATLYEERPSDHDKAAAAYRRGLELRPGQLIAATRLADLADSRGDRAGAIESAAAALSIDGESHLGWIAAARACGAPGSVDGASLATLLEAAAPATRASAPVVGRLLAAAIEVARGDLLAGMHARGHRVKNLLGIVGSRARRARKLASDPTLNARLGEVEAELTSLYEEWSQYLRSMHAEGPTFETVALRPLLDEVVSAARSRGTVAVDLVVDDPRVTRVLHLRADRVLLGEALSNLAGNAVDACAENGGRVEIVVRVRGGAARAIEITVEDSGPGIPPADLSRVLAPGFTTKESGSGLGLAIAERVVRAHRGRLLIDSEVGRGTLVTVLLPTELPSVVSAESREATR